MKIDNKIKFEREWSKLKKLRFSTVRQYTKEKEKYYNHRTNQIFDIIVNNNKYGKAILIGVYVCDPSALSTEFLRNDTDNDEKWINKILNMDKVIVLTFSSLSKQGCSL